MSERIDEDELETILDEPTEFHLWEDENYDPDEVKRRRAEAIFSQR